MSDPDTDSSGALAVLSPGRRHFNRQLRRVGWTVLIVVVAAHVLVGVGAAFLIVARYFVKPSTQFVATAKPVDVEPERRKNRLETEKYESMRPKPTINNRIQSLKPTTLALPDLPKVAVNAAIPLDANTVVNKQIDTLGTAGINNGVGVGNEGFFGYKGKIKKLGVMLDISGSTHSTLLRPLREIDRNFPQVPTVLVTGCGSSEEVPAKAFQIKPAPAMAKEYEKLAAGEYKQVATARKKSKELDAYMDGMLKRPNVYWELNLKNNEKDRILGAQYAMSFLATQGVDTIYWFADFMDKFDEKSANRIAAKLKSKGIRVIVHDFAAKDEASVNPSARGVEAAKIIAKVTGGTVVYGMKEE